MKFRAICENHLYSKAYSKGKRAVTSALAVYVLPDYQAKRLAKAHPEKRVVNRIGLTTSTKLGGAVVRSRCRRIMREGLRALEQEKRLKTGFLIVIAARSASVKLKCTEIKRQLEEYFFPITTPDSYCITDVLFAARDLLLGKEKHECGYVYGFLNTPYGITEKVTLTKDDITDSFKVLYFKYLQALRFLHVSHFRLRRRRF